MDWKEAISDFQLDLFKSAVLVDFGVLGVEGERWLAVVSLVLADGNDFDFDNFDGFDGFDIFDIFESDLDRGFGPGLGAGFDAGLVASLVAGLVAGLVAVLGVVFTIPIDSESFGLLLLDFGILAAGVGVV